MHDFENVIQFKDHDSVHIKANRDTSVSSDDGYVFYFTQLYSFVENNKTYYLGVYDGTFSTHDAGAGIEAFTIERGQLNDTVKIIKTTSGIKNGIYFNYNFFSVAYRPERPLRLIRFDSTKKIIYIPVVDESGKVTDKFIRYRFTGRYFEKIK